MERKAILTDSDARALLDENEQLRTALESSLDENGRLIEDRDRLLRRVAALARELQAAKAAFSPSSALTALDAEARQSQAEEELRVAFEELQVLTEELDVANASLHEMNVQLERRVEERTRELTRANAALNQTEAAFRTLIEGIPQLPWRAKDGGEWTWASPQWCAYTGQSLEDTLGLGWLDAFHPDDRPAGREAWARAQASSPLSFEGRIFHRPQGRYRHFRTRAAPVLGSDGQILEWLGTSTDVDDIIELQQRQSVLVDELQHRTRNLMAVVQAVMQRTASSSRSLEDFRQRFDERLQALARAQGLLARRGGAKVTFDALLREELGAHVELDREGKGARVRTHGPANIPLPSRMVQTLALALHELATNATKYGALAMPEGRLEVVWGLVEMGDGNPRLMVEWVESNVSPMPDPETTQSGGYGRELIERALPYQLGARTDLRFTPDGVHCSIELAVPFGRKEAA